MTRLGSRIGHLYPFPRRLRSTRCSTLVQHLCCMFAKISRVVIAREATCDYVEGTRRSTRDGKPTTLPLVSAGDDLISRYRSNSELRMQELLIETGRRQKMESCAN